MQFRHRSDEKEYLDHYDIKVKDLYRNLKELDIINKQLGGYSASCKGLAAILNEKKSIYTVLDIGYGGGDSIKQLSGFFTKKNKDLFFYGIDLKTDCFTYAENNLAKFNNVQLICDDYKNISDNLFQKIDVIHCSLFLHHLTDEEIIYLFKFAKSNGCIILVNDLHRNRFAYYSIKLLTSLFSKSYLVKNDAPLSVRRGFKKNELVLLLQQAGFKKYSVKWSWAFRYILIAHE